MRRLALACLAFTALEARAAHPLITEDTGTQGIGRWQLEGTSEAEKNRGAAARVTVDAFVLSYGFLENADAQVALPWHRAAADGVGDTSLDVKWRFFERDRFSLGLKPGITLPTGNERDGRGSGKLTWGTLLIASYETGSLAFHFHAGYRRHRNRLDERESLTHVSGAVVYQVGSVKLVGDAARDTSPDPATRGAAYHVVLGAIWSVRPDFDLDAGVKKGSGTAGLDDALLFGATVRW